MPYLTIFIKQHPYFYHVGEGVEMMRHFYSARIKLRNELKKGETFEGKKHSSKNKKGKKYP